MLLNLYVFILFFVTLLILSINKKNKKIAKYYTSEHKN